MIPLIVVGGPTASGKTALGVQIAKDYGGEVISADSMQIYRHMDIGSAKPTPREQQGIPHHMIDIIEPTQDFSVAEYAQMAKNKIFDIHSRGKLPVMVGGTGLYIDTVINNIILPETSQNEELRRELSEFAAEYGNEALHDKLKKTDPEAALRLHYNDTKRVIRAIEMFETTGETMSEHIRKSKLIPSPYNAVTFGIWYDRELLYDRINRRVDIMLDMGLIREVEKCVKLGCNRSHTSMQAIGYKEILDYLEGLCSRQEAADKIKMESRRYAKRQISWFKRSNINWISPGTRIDLNKFRLTKI